MSRMCLSLGLKTLPACCGTNQILKGTTIFQGRQRDQGMCRCRGMSYCISPSAKENWIVHLPSFLHLYLLFSGGSGVPLALRLQLQLLLMKNQRTHCCAYFQTFNQLQVTFRSDLVHCWPFELRRSEHCNVLYILQVRPHLPPLPLCSEPSHHDSLSPGLRPIWFSILFHDSSAILLPFEML